MFRAIFGRRHVCEDCGETCGRMKVCECEVRAAIGLAGVSTVLLLLSATALRAQADGSGPPTINQEQLVFTLPVFTICILACCSFTWLAANYISSFKKRVDDREVQRQRDREAQARAIQALQHELRALKERLGRVSPRDPEGS